MSDCVKPEMYCLKCNAVHNRNQCPIVDDQLGDYSKTAWYFVPDNCTPEVLTQAEVHYWDGKKESLMVPNMALRHDVTRNYQPQDESVAIELGKQAAKKRDAVFSDAFFAAVSDWQPEDSKCTCHERDGSYVCEHCFAQGHRGHMQKGM